MSDRDRLRELAAKATAGPWSVNHCYVDDNPEEYRYSDIRFHPTAPIFGGHPQVIGCMELDGADGDYVAACDPTTVVALLDALDAAERRALIAEEVAAAEAGEHEALRERLARVEALAANWLAIPDEDPYSALYAHQAGRAVDAALRGPESAEGER